MEKIFVLSFCGIPWSMVWHRTLWELKPLSGSLLSVINELTRFSPIVWIKISHIFCLKTHSPKYAITRRTILPQTPKRINHKCVAVFWKRCTNAIDEKTSWLCLAFSKDQTQPRYWTETEVGVSREQKKNWIQREDTISHTSQEKHVARGTSSKGENGVFSEGVCVRVTRWEGDWVHRELRAVSSVSPSAEALTSL